MKLDILNLDKHQYETGSTFLTLINTNEMKLVNTYILNLDKHQYETGTTFLTFNTNMKLVLHS